MTPNHVLKEIWTPVHHFRRKIKIFEKKAMKKAGFEPAIFQSQVKCSTNWATQPGYRDMQYFIILIDVTYITKYKKGTKYTFYLEIMKYAFMQNQLN